MSDLVSPGGFPVVEEYSYPNAAAIAAVPDVAASDTAYWQTRTDQAGLHFDSEITEQAASARRFELRRIAHAGTLGLATAIDRLRGTVIGRICCHNVAVADRLVEGLADLGAHLLFPSTDDLHSSIATMQSPRRDHVQLARHVCGDRVVVSPRIGTICMAPHLYNTAHDIDRALETLESILAEEERTGEKR
jgi:selenocysteine lyase/cysteine desulfurase